MKENFVWFSCVRRLKIPTAEKIKIHVIRGTTPNVKSRDFYASLDENDVVLAVQLTTFINSRAFSHDWCIPWVLVVPSSAGTASCNARVYNRYVFSTIPRGQAGDLRGLRAIRVPRQARRYVNRDSYTSIREPEYLSSMFNRLPRRRLLSQKRNRTKRETVGFEKFRLRGMGLARRVFKTWNSTEETALFW